MEHRNYQRKDVWVDARVWLRTGEVIPACIVNVGGEGAFVEVDNLADSPCHRIEVEFSAPNGEDVTRYRWPALVVHRSAQGVGVLFLVNEAETVPVLRTLAHAAEASLAAEKASDGKVLAMRRKRVGTDSRVADTTRDATVRHAAEQGVASR